MIGHVRIGSLFEARRFSTPHAVVDLRELHPNGVNWRVKSEVLMIEPPVPQGVDASMLRDRTRSLCTRCGQRRDRRGGKNVAHRFICAGCW